MHLLADKLFRLEPVFQVAPGLSSPLLDEFVGFLRDPVPHLMRIFLDVGRIWAGLSDSRRGLLRTPFDKSHPPRQRSQMEGQILLPSRLRHFENIKRLKERFFRAVG